MKNIVQVFQSNTLRFTALAVLEVALLTGCESKQDKALDQAKALAVSTGMAQQVTSVDSNGNTITTTVTPPSAAGQQPTVATMTIPPAPGAPKPPKTDPIVTTANAGAGPVQVGDVSATAPAAVPAGSAPIVPVEFTIPAGTDLVMRINQHISVKTSHAGDTFSGQIVEPISRNGTLIIPKGTPVRGVVDEAHKRGHFKGASILELRLTSLTLNGTEYPINTHDKVTTKKGKGKRTAGFIGGLTGAGMLIGGVASGGTGLLIGGAAGAGAGTLIAGTTGNKDINIPAESVIHFRLSEELTVSK